MLLIPMGVSFIRLAEIGTSAILNKAKGGCNNNREASSRIAGQLEV